MSAPRMYELDAVTESGGAWTGYTPVVQGKLIAIIYTKDGSTPFADTVDFAITGEDSGQNYWTELNVTATKEVAPRQPTHDNAGLASLFASTGEPVEDNYRIPVERIKFAITAGGDAKLGNFKVIVE